MVPSTVLVSRQVLFFLFLFKKHFKEVYTRVKNYVPWIKKHAADGACTKTKKRIKGRRLKVIRKRNRSRGRGRGRRRGRKGRRKSG